MSFFSKKEKEKKQLNGPSDLDIKAGGEWLNERLSEAARLKTVESGTYFRTHAFHFNKLGIATEEYMEAVYLEPKHAYAGPSWFVQKVVKSKDVSLPVTGTMEQVNTVSHVPVKENICFFEALCRLARYETVPVHPGMKKQVQTLKDPHYVDFAHKEQIVFDVEGLPCLTERGRILGNRKLKEGELSALHQFREAQTDQFPVIKWQNKSLQSIFNTKGGADDLKPFVLLAKTEAALSGVVIIDNKFDRNKPLKNWTGENWDHWDQGHFYEEAWDAVKAQESHLSGVIKLADKAGNSELKTLLHKTRLQLRLITANAFFNALRHFRGPQDGEFAERVDLSFKRIEEDIVDMKISKEDAVKIRAYIIRDSEITEVTDLFKNYKKDVGVLRDQIKNITDESIKRAQNAQITASEAPDRKQIEEGRRYEV